LIDDPTPPVNQLVLLSPILPEVGKGFLEIIKARRMNHPGLTPVGAVYSGPKEIIDSPQLVIVLALDKLQLSNIGSE